MGVGRLGEICAGESEDANQARSPWLSSAPATETVDCAQALAVLLPTGRKVASNNVASEMLARHIWAACNR